MTLSFNPLVQSLPASVPFVGPETLERARGRQFAARIGANESAFGISPVAARAMNDAIADTGCSWYCDPENFELRSALAQQHGVRMEEICVDAGIDSLLGLTVRMLTTPDATVVTSDGAYPTFNYHVAGFGAKLVKVPYRDNHEDPQALLDAASHHQATLLYLSNPDNPMGTWHDADVITQLIDALPGGTLLLLDEAYNEFADNAIAPPIDTSNEQVLRFRTFSKAYGMAGLRIGYAIGNESVISSFNKVRNHFAVNRLAQIGALASVSDTAFLQQVKQAVSDGRDRIYQMADSFGLRYLPSATNFVAVDLESTERAQTILKQLNEQGVFIRMPGVSPLNRYIRVGVGTEAEHQVFLENFSQLI